MFQDEAGFRRINKPKNCWCEKGIRPSVPYSGISIPLIIRSKKEKAQHKLDFFADLTGADRPGFSMSFDYLLFRLLWLSAEPSALEATEPHG